MEMTKLLDDAQLLKDNRVALVEQLNGLGFSHINDSTPMSEIAECIKWAGGLRDLRLATINKTTGEYKAYTEAEWDALSASSKAGAVKLGIHIRAERREFIISKDNVLRSNGAISMPWAPNTSTDVRGLTNYGDGSYGFHLDFDGKGNTDLILAHGAANNIVFEAAEQARAYKASTFADGGYDDPTVWSLPAIGELWIIYRYKNKINAALTYFFGTSQLIINDWYWSSTEFSSASAWHVPMNTGYVYNNNKTNTYRVRAVAPVPVSSSELPSSAI